MTVFIETEGTPNPNAIKFRAGVPVSPSAALDFPTRAAAVGRSQFAVNVFDVDGVARVHLGADFVSVTKDDEASWDDLKPSIMAALMDQALSGLPFVERAETAPAESYADPVVQQIVAVLNERVRPAVAMDGGDVVFDRFEDGVVYLHMRGACSGCPSATATLKAGIYNLLKHFVPEVQDVRQAA